MNVLIVGWYGTETIGDRAILASLIRHFSLVEKCNFTIASIYPFVTEHTLFEDSMFISKITHMTKDEIMQIKIVDSRKPLSLKTAIKQCDCLVMGGGPLDDMASMYMIEYAVLTAKKSHKHIMMYGIGMNVLKNKSFVSSARNIVDNSDIVVLRDNHSKSICQHNSFSNAEKFNVFIDPAVFTCFEYAKIDAKSRSNKPYIAINLRKFPSVYSSSNLEQDVDVKAQKALRLLLHNREKYECVLVPMNYFDVGIDDRVILNEFRIHNSDLNLNVVNDPLNLEQTMSVFQNASMCIGMRFHSVVFQTILNGNNYVLDYTDPRMGKTSGFITQINGEDYYQDRMISLQKSDEPNVDLFESTPFKVDESIIHQYDNLYINQIRKLLCIK